MKIDLFDVEEFIKLNKLQEVTSPVIFQRGDIPNPDGLLSNEIFGMTTKSRKETFAYIDLGGYYFNPHIYKVIRRMYRNIDKIVNGELYVSIGPDGRLVEDSEKGDTGIQFLYDNWKKINWEKDTTDDVSGMRKERESVLDNFKRNEIFMKYQIVIPVFYRDIKTGTGGGGETSDINNLYTKLIRYSSLVKNQNMFAFQFSATNYNIQNTIVDIYDYFKQKLEKKNGLIRKYLMGKSVDYSTRTVITAPTFHADKSSDLFTNFRYSSIPMAQVCSLAYPFVVHYVKAFFEQQVFDPRHGVQSTSGKNDIEFIDPENYFTDKWIKKTIDTFIKDPESRFDIIKVPSTKGMVPISFTGKALTDVTDAYEPEVRPMTVCDLLYMACENVSRTKHCEITRYPLNDDFGVFISRFRVSSTTATHPVMVNDYLYQWYPVIDYKCKPEEIGSKFIDAVQFSNSYLEGIEGDYDGDQTTVKILFTQEANEECETVMNRKAFFINAQGKMIRVVSKEALQTFYVLTKDPFGEYKPLTSEQVDYFVHLVPSDITLTKLVDWFGNTVDIAEGVKVSGGKIKSKFNTSDTLTLTHSQYSLVPQGKKINTTLGRLIFNKVLIEGLGFDNIFSYQNDVVSAKVFKGKFDGGVGAALKEDKISVDQMYKYIDTRDWFGLSLHGVITSSFTPGVLNLPKEVKDLKKKLMEENKDAIERGDEVVIEKIEKQLIAKTKELLKDDIGMDLYNSGARGSVDNHLKNIMLTRGAIKNPNTKKYEIIENSLMDGLAKKDIPTHANMIVSGAYPKAVGTQVSGYMSKELLAAFQTEVLGPKDSDCGSKRTITVTLTNDNYNDFIYRYILVGTKLIELTNENKSEYVGKTVKMRSPLYCVGIGPNRCLCNKCAGNFYYNLQKPNIGLLTSKIATTLTQMGLQKFHQNLVKTKKIDLDTIFLKGSKKV
jgi:DNA-directed RNA polymerase beta' subunit